MEDFQVIEHIKELCKERNLTYYKLAKLSDIPYSSLNTMLNKQHIPSMSNLIKICKGLDIPLSQFFSDIEKPDDQEQKLINLWNALDKNRKNMIIAYVCGILNKNISEIDELIIE